MARRRTRKVKAGLSPGTPIYMGVERSHEVAVSVIDYNAGELRESNGLAAATAQSRPGEVRWVDVDGLHQVDLVTALGERFGLHPLAVEDILNPASRPKAEEYGSYVLLIIKHLSVNDDERTPELEVTPEQISVVLGPDFVLTFQELPGDSFVPVRSRLLEGRGRLRGCGADYLAYALLDATVDRYFEVLERLGVAIDALEQEVLLGVPNELPRQVHGLRQQHQTLRRHLSPLLEAVSALQRCGGRLVREETQLYLRDVRDHLAQVNDSVDGSRESLVGLLETHIALDSQRQGEINKVLTVVATIFLPLTFIVGVYGMNFDNMPELHWKYGYALLLVVMAALAVGMRVYFKKRRWI